MSVASLRNDLKVHIGVGKTACDGDELVRVPLFLL